MERLVITIHPSSPDDGLLRVEDAMKQVIDVLRVYEAAAVARGPAEGAFEWRLERASTNSPFTIVAVAESLDRTTNVDEYVRYVAGDVAAGIRNLVYENTPAPWMTPDVLTAARNVFTRTQNGIGATDVAFGEDGSYTIDRTQADAGLRTIEAITTVTVGVDVPRRRAHGEIQGVMVAAGRHYREPAILLCTKQYGEVWCRLSAELIEKYGGEHQVRDVWDGKSIGVRGTLHYAPGGTLTRIDATSIRDVERVPTVDLNSVLDPDFTAGLDPVAYVHRLWEGTLAS